MTLLDLCSFALGKMLLWYLLDVLGILLFTNSQGISTSPKRGLVHLPSKYDADDQLWNPPTSDLTWYYNYGSTPSQAYAGSSKLQFVPMLFAAANSQNDVVFLNDVISRMKTGYNISYVLSFQEPDASNTKASSTQVELAVQAWVREMEPLKKFGAKLGAPAVTATPAGFSWLQQFFTACKGKCSIDFIPIHWYGDFAGLTSHIDRVRAVYPNLTIWVTEFADKDASLAESQSFYNQSTQYFDQTEYYFIANI